VLLEHNPAVGGAPILVVANKIDLEPHLSPEELIRELNLDYITESRWSVCAISALQRTNVAELVSWVSRHSKR
jgi:ADP-ribosylation factor-like protein 8